jgi:dolichol-phosphate mannosyltransferase
MHITIVMPTYNEAENLSKISAALFKLPDQDLNLLVVDDNSPDGTGQVADKLVQQYPGRVSVIHRAGKLGFGSAYIQGFQQALEQGADVVGQMDADFSHPPEKIAEMISKLETCDLVVGSRYVPGGSLDHEWPAWRQSLSAFGNMYARTILRIPLKDVTGGFRFWHRRTMQGIPLNRVRSNGYAFQVEMAYIAHRLGFRFQEVPIHFAERRWGDSKMSFRIQAEAAVRVWQTLWAYRDLKKVDGQ